MRKIALLLLFVSLNVFSQNYPGSSPELLKGKDLKVLPKPENLQKFGYRGFYKDEALKTAYACCDAYNAKYAEMVNKVFNVVDVLPYKNAINKNKFKLVLKDESGKTLYFDYDPVYDFDYPFEVVGGLQLPEDFYCKSITTNSDKFTNEVKYFSPIVEGFTLMKIVKGQDKHIYMNVKEGGSTPNVNKKGVILLLTDGKRIDKPEVDIDVEVDKGGSGYVYSAFFELTKSDIELLTKYDITDDRLYIYDGTITGGYKIREYLKCLVKL